MFGLGKVKNLVGLDIGSSAVKAVELRKKGNSYELVNLGIEPLGQDTVVDGAIMDALSVSSAIEKIFNDNRIKTRNVATSVSGHSVIVKRVTVGANSEEELYSAIPYEAQQHIPFDMADVNLSYQSLGPSPAGNGTDVMLVAVKREKILNHTNVLSQAGKIPTVVDYDGFAVYNAFEVNYESSSRPDGGAAEYRRQHHEHRHRAGRQSAVHPRRLGGRKPVHGHAAEGTGLELRGRGKAEAGI